MDGRPSDQELPTSVASSSTGAVRLCGRMHSGRVGPSIQQPRGIVRLLANENIPLATVEALRAAGEDVLSVTEDSPGATDEAVIQWAKREERIVVTFDRDYGELVFHHRLPPPAGVLYMRFEPKSPKEPAVFIEQLKEDGVELEGRFTVVNRDGIRQRPIRTGDTT